MDRLGNPTLTQPEGPHHVAIVMDGNRRWARQRDLPAIEGHRAGVGNLNRVLQSLGNQHVKHVSLFVFSTENWRRNDDEIGMLQAMLLEIVTPKSRELHQHGVKIRHLGSLQGIPSGTRRRIQGAERLTQNNDRMVLNIAFNYGSRQELVQAIQNIVSDGIAGTMIHEAKVEEYLYTRGQPDVDLLIRTGGERRLSNFLLWQSAYAEIYFSDVLWPDFDDNAVDEAVKWFRGRQRRFGR